MIAALRSMKPSDYELDHKSRRAQVHELAIQVAKLGILRAEHMRDDFSSWAMAISPLLNWDIAVLTKLVIHFQLFGGTVVELGTERHQKWVDLINSGQVIGGFAMYVGCKRLFFSGLTLIRSLCLSPRIPPSLSHLNALS